MAAAEEVSLDSDEEELPDMVKCGNCCDEEGYIINPKILPCSHTYCEKCLLGHQSDPNQIKCFECKNIIQSTVDALPSALGDKPSFCDTCNQRETKFMTANVFCITCNTKLCGKHSEHHNIALVGHSMMGIKNYVKSPYAGELRPCEKHTGEPYVIGCNVCLKVYCALCLSTAEKCTSDCAHHSLISLRELVTEVKKSFEPLKKIAEERFNEFSAVVKEATVTAGQWNEETKKGIRFIHSIRDTQVEAIKDQYHQIEEEYKTSRDQSKAQIDKYLEKDAGEKLTKIYDQLKKLRSNLSELHPVDLVNTKVEIEDEIKKLESESFPHLTLKNQQTVVRRDIEDRSIEVEIVPGDDIVVGPRSGELPSVIQKIREVPVNDSPRTVCHYKGVTFVGTNGMWFGKIDGQENTATTLKIFNDLVVGIIAHANKIYVLRHGNPYVISVHDTEGKQLLEFYFEDQNSTNANAIAIVNDHLIIANNKRSCIDIYTLTGTKLRSIPCPLIGRGYVSLCGCGEDDVVVADRLSNKVFRVSLPTGTIQWTSDAVKSPIGVCQHRNQYVLVTTHDPSSKPVAWILDSDTGQTIGELTCDERKDHSVDMCVEGDTLVIPQFFSKMIKFYKLSP